MTAFQKLLIKGRKHQTAGHRVRAKFIKKFMNIWYQCDIPLEADIDDSVYFCHAGFGVVINPNVRIGKNTILQHRVTIGELSSGGVPTIGNNCFIGAGAIILGDITIGDNSKVGAGAVVMKDVKENSTVVGVPAHNV